ncbi:MAG: hypothetical protein FVQ82_06395 [Planctomycetes bacterium]|nr:hypothetical protein [Planctomycetota bacterium]
MLTICVAGKNDIASNTLSYLCNHFGQYRIIALPNKNDCGKDTWQKSLRFASNKLGVDVFDRMEDLFPLEDFIFLSLEFDKIIKVEDFVSNRLYNIHFSKLPQYRGMFTSALPILHGKQSSGVTLHVIDNGIDTGDIIDQMEFPIECDDTARDLYLKYNEYAFEVLKNNIESLIDNTYKQLPQDSFGATYYSKSSIDYSYLDVDFNKTAFEVCNQIRAYSFKEYQLPSVFGFQISNSAITGNRSKGKPGTLVDENTNLLMVSTIDYDVELSICS